MLNIKSNIEHNRSLTKGQKVVAFLDLSKGSYAMVGGRHVVTTLKSAGPKRVSCDNGFSRPHEEAVVIPVEHAAMFYLVNVHKIDELDAKLILTSDLVISTELIQKNFKRNGNYRGNYVDMCSMIVREALILNNK